MIFMTVSIVWQTCLNQTCVYFRHFSFLLTRRQDDSVGLSHAVWQPLVTPCLLGVMSMAVANCVDETIATAGEQLVVAFSVCSIDTSNSEGDSGGVTGLCCVGEEEPDDAGEVSLCLMTVLRGGLNLSGAENGVLESRSLDELLGLWQQHMSSLATWVMNG